MSEWQPIKTVPEYAVVLLYFPATEKGRNGHAEMMRIDRADAYPFRRPTHWQYLPSPPPPSGEGGK